MTEQEYLEDTIKYYSKNPKKLRCEYSGTCTYSSGEKGVVGCAIGRKLTKKNREYFDRQYMNGIAIEDILDVDSDKKLLPVWMRNMSGTFLINLQGLHDSERYWDDRLGLSCYGKGYVKSKFSHLKLEFLENY